MIAISKLNCLLFSGSLWAAAFLVVKMKNLGIHAVVSLLTYLVTCGLSFRAIMAVHVEKYVRRGHIFEAQVLALFLAIALGFLVGQFLLTLVDQSQALLYLFKD